MWPFTGIQNALMDIAESLYRIEKRQLNRLDKEGPLIPNCEPETRRPPSNPQPVSAYGFRNRWRQLQENLHGDLSEVALKDHYIAFYKKKLRSAYSDIGQMVLRLTGSTAKYDGEMSPMGAKEVADREIARFNNAVDHIKARKDADQKLIAELREELRILQRELRRTEGRLSLSIQQVADLNGDLEEVIEQRDALESHLTKCAEHVVGPFDWSSEYGYADAVDSVEEAMVSMQSKLDYLDQVQYENQQVGNTPPRGHSVTGITTGNGSGEKN